MNRDTLLPLIDLALEELQKMKNSIESHDNQALDGQLIHAHSNLSKLFGTNVSSKKMVVREGQLGAEMMSLQNTGLSISECKRKADQWEITINYLSDEIL